MFHNGMFGGGMWVGWIFWIIILGIAIYGTSRILGRKSSENGDREDSPVNILNKRYAKGEINKEEFDRIKIDL